MPCNDTEMNVEVRATGLRAMREKKGLTQRELAHNLGISQNYIPALESGARRPGPKLRQALMKFFKADFEELFEVVMVNPESSAEQVLEPRDQRRAG
jgi:transcriptional regulator with XRE-family HTH domain